MKKLNRILLSILCLIFVLAIGFEYILSYKFRTQPPSEEWSKGVLISKGKVKNYPRVIRSGKNYVVTHDDGDKIKVLLIDSMGNKLNEKEFSGGDELLLDLNLLHDDEDIYLNWVTIADGSKILNNIKLNDNFEIIKEWKVKNIIDTTQLDDTTMAVLYNDRVEVYDVRDSKVISTSVNSPSLIAGAKTDRGYIITYWENQQSFKYFFVKDGNISVIKTAGEVTTSKNMSLTKSTIECDDNNGYMILEARTSNEYGIPRYITFDLDNGEGKSTRFKIDYYGEFAYNPVGVSSGDGARFLISYERGYGMREIQKDIVDITIKDGQIVKRAYVTNSGSTMMYPSICDDAAVYCELIGQKDLNIYMTSTRQDFKEMHNIVRGEERFRAFTDTLLGFLNSLVGIVTVGIRWIVIAGVLISMFGLFSYKFKHKAALKVYSIIYIVISAAKLFTIYDIFYKEPIYNLPVLYSQPIAGMITCGVISIISFLYGLTLYKIQYENDSYTMPILSITIAALIDTIVTQILFIPFMP